MDGVSERVTHEVELSQIKQQASRVYLKTTAFAVALTAATTYLL